MAFFSLAGTGLPYPDRGTMFVCMALPDGDDEREVEPDIEQIERDLDHMRDELEDMLGTLAERLHAVTDVRLQVARHPWGLVALGALVLGGAGAALWRHRRPVAHRSWFLAR